MEFTKAINLAISVLTFLGLMYAFIWKPREKSERTDALIKQAFENHEKAQDKEFDAFETKLVSLKENINNLRDNHIHTLQEKIDNNSKSINEVKQSVVKIETILNERLPKNDV